MMVEESTIMAKFNKLKSAAKAGDRVLLSPLILEEDVSDIETLPPDGEPIVRWTISLTGKLKGICLCHQHFMFHSGEETGWFSTPALGDYPNKTLALGFSQPLTYPCELAITLYSRTLIIEMVADDGAATEIATAGVTEALTRWVCRWWKKRLEEEDV